MARHEGVYTQGGINLTDIGLQQFPFILEQKRTWSHLSLTLEEINFQESAK